MCAPLIGAIFENFRMNLFLLSNKDALIAHMRSAYFTCLAAAHEFVFGLQKKIEIYISTI